MRAIMRTGRRPGKPPRHRNQVHRLSVFGLASCWLWFSSVGATPSSKPNPPPPPPSLQPPRPCADYNKIIIRTDNISYYYSNIENLADINGNKQFFSNIVFWKSKADILPHQVIKYNNEDGGNSFTYKIENKQLNSIIFKLTNERGEYITDASDYMMVVQFNFYEQEDVNGTLKSLVMILNQIYSALLFSMNRLRLLL